MDYEAIFSLPSVLLSVRQSSVRLSFIGPFACPFLHPIPPSEIDGRSRGRVSVIFDLDIYCVVVVL